MITLSVCLEPLYTTLPVDERIAKIAEAGFRSVEFWHPEGTWDGAGIRTDRAKDAGGAAAGLRATERRSTTSPCTPGTAASAVARCGGRIGPATSNKSAR